MKQATAEPEEWIQIDLKTVHMITATETQGRFGNGQGIEYAEAYMIEYWRPRLQKWIRYHNSKGEEVIQNFVKSSNLKLLNRLVKQSFSLSDCLKYIAAKMFNNPGI